ncbi:MAG: hypothetical protein CR986_00825 [Ignavibacteriae bacterium]|nr:MAG: hypothetical protein CR986_00825 [Ignavibacteriota bacterium]
MKSFYKIILIIVFTLNIVCFAQGFGSSNSSDARTISLAGANTVFTSGVYTLGNNPANLTSSFSNNFIELSTVFPLPSVNLNLGNDFITLDDYRYFFTGVRGNNGEVSGRHLSTADKEKFMDLFQNGSMVNTNLGINLFSVSLYPSKIIGAFGFAVQDFTSAKFELPQQLIELFLYGNTAGRKFNLNNFDAEAWYVRNYALTYSKDLSNIFQDAFNFVSVGVSLKMVHGFFYAGVDKMNTTLETESDFDIVVNGDSRMLMSSSPSFGIVHDFEKNVKREVNIGAFNKPAGKGFGADFGFYTELTKAWAIAFAVTDIGSIKWNKGTVEYVATGSYTIEDITDETLVDSLTDAISGEGRATSAFTTVLPTAMKLGVGLKVHELATPAFPGKLYIEANYHQGFNDVALNNMEPKFSISAEWIPMGWLKVRTGLSKGGIDKFNWAAGVGLNIGLVELDFAAAFADSLINGNKAKRVGFALSSRWIF